MDKNWKAMIKVLRQQEGTLEIKYQHKYDSISIVLREGDMCLIKCVHIKDLTSAKDTLISNAVGMMASQASR